tara:strand:+ start:1556 stop:2275 length:720 start_codon:yes stop_codon:yes gene_type:complete
MKLNRNIQYLQDLIDNKNKVINSVIGKSGCKDRDALDNLFSEVVEQHMRNIEKFNEICDGTKLKEDGTLKYKFKGQQGLLNYTIGAMCISLRQSSGTFSKLHGKYDNSTTMLEAKHEKIANTEDSMEKVEMLEMIDLILELHVSDYKTEIFRAKTDSIENDKGLFRTLSYDDLMKIYPNEKRSKLHAIVTEVQATLQGYLSNKTDEELEPLRELAAKRIMKKSNENYSTPYKAEFKLLC